MSRSDEIVILPGVNLEFQPFYLSGSFREVAEGV